MSNTSRAILVSFVATTITVVILVVIAVTFGYVWVRAGNDPSRGAVLGWIVVFTWPHWAIQICISSVVVGIIAGVFSRIRHSRKRRIFSLAAATIAFVMTVVVVAIVLYAWVHASVVNPSRLVENIVLFFWPILTSLLFVPATIVGMVVGVFLGRREVVKMATR